jgi:hypothetical protein
MSSCNLPGTQTCAVQHMCTETCPACGSDAEHCTNLAQCTYPKDCALRTTPFSGLCTGPQRCVSRQINMGHYFSQWIIDPPHSPYVLENIGVSYKPLFRAAASVGGSIISVPLTPFMIKRVIAVRTLNVPLLFWIKKYHNQYTFSSIIPIFLSTTPSPGEWGQ